MLCRPASIAGLLFILIPYINTLRADTGKPPSIPAHILKEAKEKQKEKYQKIQGAYEYWSSEVSRLERTGRKGTASYVATVQKANELANEATEIVSDVYLQKLMAPDLEEYQKAKALEHQKAVLEREVQSRVAAELAARQLQEEMQRKATEETERRLAEIEDKKARDVAAAKEARREKEIALETIEVEQKEETARREKDRQASKSAPTQSIGYEGIKWGSTVAEVKKRFTNLKQDAKFTDKDFPEGISYTSSSDSKPIIKRSFVFDTGGLVKVGVIYDWDSVDTEALLNELGEKYGNPVTDGTRHEKFEGEELVSIRGYWVTFDTIILITAAVWAHGEKQLLIIYSNKESLDFPNLMKPAKSVEF